MVRDEYSSAFTGTVVDLLFGKTLFCVARVFPYIPQWMDKPWYTVRMEREWQEHGGEINALSPRLR
jgi:hypothetical protein